MHDLLLMLTASEAAWLLPSTAWLPPIIPALWAKVWPYLLMVVGFSFIIFVHELGHFLAAKWAGVRVDRFAIGFGREIVGFTWGQTRYSFNFLPFGGYVKMLGQEDFDDKQNELKFKDDPDSFVNQSVGRRMVIVSAGVVMNLLLAFVLFAVVFSFGIESLGTRVGFVIPDSPADRGGLVQGDRILKINGQRTREWFDVNSAILLAPPFEDIEFVVERDGSQMDPIYVRPEVDEAENRLMVGIAPGSTSEIVVVNPNIDTTRSDRPRPGDLLVRFRDQQITSENVNDVRRLLAYLNEPVLVERKDPAHPDRPRQMVEVHAPPAVRLALRDGRDPHSADLLGLVPPVRISEVMPGGRAALAGLEVGDTIVEFADYPLPTRAHVSAAIRDNPERDLSVVVRKPDGRRIRTFVRPRSIKNGPGVVEAKIRSVSSEAQAGRAVFDKVQPRGAAHQAGIRTGDVIAAVGAIEFPPVDAVEQLIRQNAGKKLLFQMQRTDGTSYTTIVRPVTAGTSQARYELLADDLVQVAAVNPRIGDRPSPAAEAGIPRGALIQSVNDAPVADWGTLIALFRTHAGSTVTLGYQDVGGAAHTAVLAVPHCLRTLLGIGPEALIVTIDGRSSVVRSESTAGERVSVSQHRGLRQALADRVGEKEVVVQYRAHPTAPLQTARVEVTADVVDPWLGRVVFEPAFHTGAEIVSLKGENLADAVVIGVHKTHQFVMQVYTIINRMLFSRTVSAENISGPLGIVDIGGQAARAGIIKFLFFLAIISANLAVINFLPLPIMDGGLFVFLIIEKIKGSPVSINVQVATQTIGVVLIAGIFLFVTCNDVTRLLGG